MGLDYSAAKKTIVGEWDLDKNKIIENNRDKLNENQVKDIEAFEEVLGPFKAEELYEDNIGKKIQKFANNSYTQKNKQQLIQALSSLPSDHGAIRILRSIGNVEDKLSGVASMLFKRIERS